MTAALQVWWSVPPSERASRLVAVALHGRGADERSLAVLEPDLPDDVVLACPRGFWPEGQGFAWWQMHAIGYPVAASLASARGRLLRWLDDELDGAQVALLGFSDGAVTALDLLLAEPGRFRAAALLGGALPWNVLQPAVDSLSGLPVLFSYGDRDDVVDRGQLERTGRWLREESGADVHLDVEQGLGHAVSAAQVGRAGALFSTARPSLRA